MACSRPWNETSVRLFICVDLDDICFSRGSQHRAVLRTAAKLIMTVMRGMLLGRFQLDLSGRGLQHTLQPSTEEGHGRPGGNAPQTGPATRHRYAAREYPRAWVDV